MIEPSSNPDITRILQRVRNGDEKALGDLMPVVYEELRRIARLQLRRDRSNGTIQTTVLVHEAFLRMSKGQQLDLVDRAHFYAFAATAMRHVLVDHARRRKTLKRGGDWERVDFDTEELNVEDQADLILEINNALEKLSELNARLTHVVECRFFAGMTVEETALALHVTDRTIRRDWIKARAWLHEQLGAA